MNGPHGAALAQICQLYRELPGVCRPLVGRSLCEDEIQAFEAKHAVHLPSGFRAFLLTFGDAAYVPRVLGQRLRPIADHASWPVYRSFAGAMNQDFTHCGTQPAGLACDDELDDYVRYDHMRGTLCLGSDGCDVVRILVVTGRERGRVWTFVPGCEWALDPTGLTFLDWCIEGLEQELTKRSRN